MRDYKLKVTETLRKYCQGEKSEYKEKVATACGVQLSTVDRWLSLKDTNSPKFELLPIICETLEITLYELFQIELSDDLDKRIKEYLKKD